MLQVISLEDARSILGEFVEKREKRSEEIPLFEARGSVLAKNLFAKEDLPAFDRSAVDGFALSARDSFGASVALPALLRLAGEIRMGERAQISLASGECAAVWTGGELPHGADAVAMLEETESLPGGWVAVESPSAPGQHVVFCGDDAKRGELLLPKGTRLSAREIGLLAAFGTVSVPIFRKPRVCVLSTGDELIDPAETPRGAQIRDVNGAMLVAACGQSGAEARFLGRLPDDEELLRSAMRAAAQECDLLLLSGGSSAGAKDAAARCLASLGYMFFHGLALKPGKPAFAGRIGDTSVVGLPGHPAAAYLVFHALVRPLLAALAGESGTERTVPAMLAQAAPSNHGREELLLVRLDGDIAEPVHAKSGLVTPLTQADGYVRIPRDAEGLPKGARVDVILFE